MSVYMNVENTVSGIVEAMLPKMSSHRLGLMVTLEITAEDFGSEQNVYDTASFGWAELTFIFMRPSNYTQVYVTKRFDRYTPDKWEFKSDHDSCWSSDGLNSIFEMICEVCERTNSNKSIKSLNPVVRISSYQKIEYVLLKERIKDGKEVSYYYEKDNNGRVVKDFEIEKKMTLTEAIPYLQMKSKLVW